MRIAVVYESMFGTTRQVANAVAEGCRGADEDVTVLCVPVAEARPELLANIDVLIVGGPTHIRGMTTGMSRKMGLQGEKQNAEDFHPEPDALGPGIRDWLHDLAEAPTGRRAAAFDTRVAARFAGGAAHGIARRLRHRGYQPIAEPEGFIVDGTEGPVHDGELQRAAAWAEGLVATTAQDTSSAGRRGTR